MTKQEEIDRTRHAVGIALKLATGGDDNQVEAIKRILSNLGVVIKVDRELNENIPPLCVVNLVEGRGYPNCMNGYTEPLIKESE